MASNSFQGVNSVSGVNSFGGENSFDGGNSFQPSPDSRNIQISQIKDTGLRSLLQNQFSPVNSYSKLGVAPLGQVKSAADQYQTLDLAKLDDPTKGFLQPYLTGKMSSVNPTQAFIHRDRLATARTVMDAENARHAQTSQQAGTPSRTFNYSLYSYPFDSARANEELGNQNPNLADTEAWKKMLYDRITSSTADYQSRYEPGKASIEKYVGYGFRPGYDYGDWKWQPENLIAASFHNSPAVDENGTPYDPNPVHQDDFYDPDAGHWFHISGSPRAVTYNPLVGFGEADYDHKATGLGKIMPALTFGVMNMIAPGLGSVAQGVSAGANSGDWSKAIPGALSGAVSAFAPGLGETLGTSLGVGTPAGNALAQAGVAGLGSKLSGQSTKDSLIAAGMGGLGTYGGSLLKGWTNGDPLLGALAKAGLSAGMGGIGSLINGGQFGQGLLSGGLGSLASSAIGSAVNETLGEGRIPQAISGVAKTALINELNKKRRRS